MLGKKINEKQKHSHEDKPLAESLHLIWGLNHYPNYLYRQSVKNIQELENQLQTQLEIVRAQKEEMVVIERITADFLSTRQIPFELNSLAREILDDDLCDCLRIRDITIGDLVKTPMPSSEQHRIIDVIEEECSGAYSFQLLKASAGETIVELSDAFAAFLERVREDAAGKSDTERRAISVFCQRPFTLASLGLRAIEDLVIWVGNGIRGIVYPAELKRDVLDWSTGFIVGYTADSAVPTLPNRLGAMRSGLVAHTDDSEMTVNIALVSGDSYEGGELVLRGMRGGAEGRVMSDGNRPEELRYRPASVGRCLVHLGRRIHEVSELVGGARRFNMIFWLRSSSLRGRICPCCWMNNSDRDGECVCGDAWN